MPTTIWPASGSGRPIFLSFCSCYRVIHLILTRGIRCSPAIPVGLPGRAIRCEFLDRIASGIREDFKCPWKCLKSCDFKNAPYCIGAALTNAKKGDLKHGFAFAGTNAYRLNKIISVKELIDTLAEEYSRCCSLTDDRRLKNPPQR